jgi:23S rRNA (uridine2552-2'-O)-methyltransferase
LYIFPVPKPYVPNDKWSQRAAKEGYRARSVFKLMELDERFHLLEPGMHVLDLGAAPGSWLQYASKKIFNGRALGLDLQEIAKIGPNVTTRVCDILDPVKVGEELKALAWKNVDLILSDLAPNTSGIKDVDQWRSVELCAAVLTLAQQYLKRRGTVVMKIFRGRDFDAFIQRVRVHFPILKIVTVKASRDRSREVYVVAKR